MAQTKIANRQIAGGLDGWIPAEETWTYASADDPTYTFTVAADVTAKYSAGMRVKYTQATVKYGIITAVSAYSGGNTTITIYGGTDYTMTSAAISSNSYSMVKAPQGFPLDPSKWSEVLNDSSTDAKQTNPTDGAWYNLSSLSLSVPIGSWNLSYALSLQGDKGSAVTIYLKSTLSTANNTESDTRFTTTWQTSTVSLGERYSPYVEATISVGSKTVYYLNCASMSNSLASIRNQCNQRPCHIRATCAYL